MKSTLSSFFLKIKYLVLRKRPIINSFSYRELILLQGGIVTLTWETQYALEVSLNHGIGALPKKGMLQLVLKKAGQFELMLTVLGIDTKLAQTILLDVKPIAIAEIEKPILANEKTTITNINPTNIEVRRNKLEIGDSTNFFELKNVPDITLSNISVLPKANLPIITDNNFTINANNTSIEVKISMDELQNQIIENKSN